MDAQGFPLTPCGGFTSPLAPNRTSETWKDSGGGSIHAFAWDYDLAGNRTYQSYNRV